MGISRGANASPEIFQVENIVFIVRNRFEIDGNWFFFDEQRFFDR